MRKTAKMMSREEYIAAYGYNLDTSGKRKPCFCLKASIFSDRPRYLRNCPRMKRCERIHNNENKDQSSKKLDMG